MKNQHLLAKARPASSAICPGCERDCVMPVHVLPGEGKRPVRAFIACDKRGDTSRVPIPLTSLIQWQCGVDAVCGFVAASLGLRRSDKQSSSPGLFEIGIATGGKRSQMLCLQANGALALVAGNNPLPLAEAVEYHGGAYSLDGTMIRQLVDAATTADIFPWLGVCPVGEITAPDLLAAIRRIESRGALETAHRALANCGQVFRYAVATGRAQRDTAADLRGSLPPVKEKHHASITDPKAIGELLRDIEGYQGAFITRCALRLAPLVFLRPGELRKAEWAEIDPDKAEWRIPAARMKMNAVHIVPLSTQAVAILREIQPLTGEGKYVFPGARTTTRPMSENAVLAALRRMDYATDEMTGHGFRSMASTLLNEQGFNRDAIERQLAHAERDGVRAAYNYAEYMPERKRMMQQWADYLDTLKNGAQVIPLRANSATR